MRHYGPTNGRSADAVDARKHPPCATKRATASVGRITTSSDAHQHRTLCEDEHLIQNELGTRASKHRFNRDLKMRTIATMAVIAAAYSMPVSADDVFNDLGPNNSVQNGEGWQVNSGFIPNYFLRISPGDATTSDTWTWNFYGLQATLFNGDALAYSSYNAPAYKVVGKVVSHVRRSRQCG